MLLWAFAWQYTVVSSRGPNPPAQPTDQPTTHPSSHPTSTTRFPLFSLSLSFLHMCVRPMLFEQLPEICTATTPKHRYPLNDQTITTGQHNVSVIMRGHRRWNRSTFECSWGEIEIILLTANSIIFKLMFVQTGRIIDLARALINNSMYALGHVI